MTALFQHWGASYGWAWFLATIIGILVIALPLMLAVAMVIYAERKIWAAMALRRGPNVVGPWGLLQSFADGLKVFLKETIIPTSANKGLFLIAPIVTFTVALIVWAVVPFAPGVVLADVNVGLLYVLAASSLGVYGVIVAGWASNSKYPFFSALRAAAQMVSYEVSIGFVLITVVLYAGTFNLSVIVLMQKGFGFGIVNAFGFHLLLFPMWVVFLISSMAETFRTPFDLVEAESELVAGHQTEYSSMSFALFWLGEYANVILMCALNAILFWGGWLPPIDWAPLYLIPGIIWLFAKMLFFFFVFGWVKATVPRYRYDQLMRLGWKIFLPLSLLFVVLVSGWLMLTRFGTNATMVSVGQSAEESRDVFACSYIKNEKSDPDSHFVDLRAERRTTSDGDVWLLQFADGSSVKGRAFDASFGSVGGGTGIEWRDKSGKLRRAFVSYSDVVSENGQKAMFLSLDKPSLWQPPGYVCQTAALKENRQ
jgi:NADH-quinone oxidoreductase subunit H